MGYITRDEVATWGDATGQDVHGPSSLQVDWAIESAAESINRICNRHFDSPPSTAETWRYFNGGTSFSPVSQISIVDMTTVTAVADAEETVPAAEWVGQSYRTDWPISALTRLTEAGALGRWSGPVDVTGTPGWAAVPDAIKQASVLRVWQILKRTDMPYGGGFDGFALPRFDPDIMDLLSSFRRPSVGGVIRPVKIA